MAQKKVYDVTKVTLTIKKDQVEIVANGSARTGGWTNPQLSRYTYVTQPADGMQEFDFVAEEPTGNVTTAFDPIKATSIIPSESWIKGVRIYAETNTMEGYL